MNDPSRRLRMLVVVPALPMPDRTSGCRRLVALLSHCANTHTVDLYVTSGVELAKGSERHRELLTRAGIRVLVTDRFGWLVGCLQRRRYDVVLFEFWQTAEEFADRARTIQPWAKIVVDSVDVHFVRELAAAGLGLYPPERAAANRERELAIYRSADAVVVVTENDEKALVECGGMPPIYTIPNSVPARPRPDIVRSANAVFIGNFAHPPNGDGAVWYLREVWPTVRERVPTATWTVCGDAPPKDLQQFNGSSGVEVTGHVLDTGPFLDRAAVSVAPLRFGGGMKGKVSEALAAGVPVVTTSTGAQGFGIVSGEHALIADAADDFAAAVIRVLGDADFARRLGRNGRQLADRVCTEAVANQRMDELLGGIGRDAHPKRGIRSHARSAIVHSATWVHDVFVRRVRDRANRK
jgi:glycosyltransferase involved in cell wall biosynthesis